MNAIFRGAADARDRHACAVAGELVNIVLAMPGVDGSVPKMELTGRRGHNIGRGVGVAYQFWSLFLAKARGRASGGPPSRSKLMLAWLAISLPGTFQYAIATASWLPWCECFR